MRKNIVNALFVLASTLVSLFAIDVAFFFLFNRSAAPDRGLYIADPEIGFRLNPDYKGVIHTKVGDRPAAVNSRGFRGPEWSLDGRARIAFAGDSFTFGLPHEVERGFVHKVGLKVDGIEAINLGVPSYGPPHIRATIERTCGTIKPRHVFYMFYLNDTRADNVSTEILGVVDGYLVNRKGKDGKPRPEEEIRRNIEAAVGKRIWSVAETLQFINIRTFLSERGLHPRQVVERLRGGPADTSRYLHTVMDDGAGKGSSYTPGTVAAAAREIAAMRDVAKACGADFTMVLLPSQAEAYYGVREPATERLLTELPKDLELLDLRRFTRRFVDLTQWYDAHYSEVGTDFVSDAVAGYLAGRYGLTTRLAAPGS